MRLGDRRLWAIAAVLASACFFGLNATATKLLYQPDAPARFDAIGLVIARSAWTLPLFLALAFFARPRERVRPTRRDLWLFAFCGFAYGPGTTGTYAIGVGLTSVAHAVLFFSLGPAAAALLAALFLRERLGPARIASLCIGVAGAAILTLTRSTSGATPEGDAFVTLQVVMWAALTLGIRMLAKSYPPLFVTGVFGALGSAIIIAIGASLGRLDVSLVPLHHFDARTIGWFDIELVLLLSVTAQLLQSVALRYLGVGLVSAITSYGSIFVGVLASIFIIGERMSLYGILAALLLVVALGLALVPNEKHESA